MDYLVNVWMKQAVETPIKTNNVESELLFWLKEEVSELCRAETKHETTLEFGDVLFVLFRGYCVKYDQQLAIRMMRDFISMLISLEQAGLDSLEKRVSFNKLNDKQRTLIRKLVSIMREHDDGAFSVKEILLANLVKITLPREVRHSDMSALITAMIKIIDNQSYILYDTLRSQQFSTIGSARLKNCRYHQ